MNIEANGSVSDLQSLDQVDLDLLASRPDLARILRLFGVHRVGEAPLMVALGLRRRGPTVIVAKGHMVFADSEFDLDARLPKFPSPDHGSLHLRTGGSDFARLRDVLQLPGRAVGPDSLAFDTDVTAAGMAIAKLDIESQPLRATASARPGAAPEYAGTEFELKPGTESRAELGSAYGVANLPGRALAIDAAAAVLAEGLRARRPVVVRSGDVTVESRWSD
jgi:hypothetical protein